MNYMIEKEFKTMINDKEPEKVFSYYLLMDYSYGYNKLVSYINNNFINQYEDGNGKGTNRSNFNFISKDIKQVVFTTTSKEISIIDSGLAGFIDNHSFMDYIIMD